MRSRGSRSAPWPAPAAFLLARQQATETPELLQTGAHAPAFALTSDSGGRFSLPPAPDGVLVLAFLSPTCGHCEKTAPHLVRLRGEGTRVVAIDAASSSDDCRPRFSRESLGGTPLLADPGSAVSKRYRAELYPTIYVIRPDGTIADAWIGETSESRFEDAVEAARA